MDLDDQIELEHILFFDRKCRVCGKVKNLMNDFYISRKDRKVFTSAYSYECKECTKQRIIDKRRVKKDTKLFLGWEYPDW
jgi:predicted SprT family Zn-dependent metalloprotease